MHIHPILAAALAPFAPPQSAVHRQQFNDDDFYVIDAATNKVVRHVAHSGARPQPEAGQYVVRGLRARNIPGVSL